MSYFLQLPNELLEDIIHITSRVEFSKYRFIGWKYPDHEYDLLQPIALTCRRLYILCAPYLWRDKEFILPREDDDRRRHDTPMATDILSTQGLFPNTLRGHYVRSLSRDLINGTHYDMNNSELMAQLVCHLRALRIDFHPKTRSEHYGLRLFAQFCPSLSELYLENCRDTYDDFQSLIEYRRSLTSLTLLCCTIKQDTLSQLIDLFKPTLRSLLFQRVLIEQQQFNKATPIPIPLYRRLLSCHLTQLALSDSLGFSLVQTIVQNSPKLEKLAIILHELEPVLVTRSILLLATLDSLVILSLAFRRVQPLSTVYERLPCCAPARLWSHFASRLPSLQLIHVSTSRLLLNSDFMARFFQRQRQHVMLHHIAWCPKVNESDAIDENDENGLWTEYLNDLDNSVDTVDAWQSGEQREHGRYILTCEEAKSIGFKCFDNTDRVCFVKGFDDWKT
ncbi:hypothetical protein DFQ28_005921 [Apophysomyces sp. BC1034]|nr:hypothetical protein DFQ30_005836 [Apophysomyces sp. BC1015]KAG0177430.1 hypothetical protein DFQ29_004823 [Apophysomyces sp. BC1021]KAG0187726.1 hypothetical protein DFQ28_005921 [Apophysomyces sp. BC1034]